jgi:hypothetical protein
LQPAVACDCYTLLLVACGCVVLWVFGFVLLSIG